MTHEFKTIVKSYLIAKKQGLKSVLVTVVDLDGSSYRKPGVRMLILENDEMIGAVSGGCVEKDILRESQSVFQTGHSKMMTYDGRYRLGCEGLLYILIEEFQPNNSFIKAFQNCLTNRSSFTLYSYYSKTEGESYGLGTYFKLENSKHLVSKFSDINKSLSLFIQKMPPCFKLMIFGAEHDAVHLCTLAQFNGWEVTIVSGPLESKSIKNFPGATAFYSASPDNLELNSIDNETAIVLMSHNFANDLKYLIELKHSTPAYLGILGPSKRREKLLSQFLEYCPDIEESFVENIHGPAGLNIGAETPQEIAISILSEILSVIRKQEPIFLKEKIIGIHS
ncbi:MAG: XshC-Cox1-family protein [Bacteroidetes bacterium]|nr:MAG: XshC-Cox1-family protein [Bacteroidota bacterium]